MSDTDVNFREADISDVLLLSQAETQCFGADSWDESVLKQMMSVKDLSFQLLEVGKDLASWVVWGTGGQSVLLKEIPNIEKLRAQGCLSQRFDCSIVSRESRLARVMSVASVPRWRRLGFGRLLLSTGLERVKDSGYAGAVLEVRSSNIVARKFYAELGFEKIADLPNWFHSPREDGEIWAELFSKTSVLRNN